MARASDLREKRRTEVTSLNTRTERKFGIGAVLFSHISCMHDHGLARKGVEVVKVPDRSQVIKRLSRSRRLLPSCCHPRQAASAAAAVIRRRDQYRAATPAPHHGCDAGSAASPQAPVSCTAPTPAPPAVRALRSFVPIIAKPWSGCVPVEAGSQHPGEVCRVHVGRQRAVPTSSSKLHESRFNKPAIQMIQTRLTCKGQGQDVKLSLPISFKLN